MAPKKDKEIVDDDFWRTFIERAILNEESWKVKVVIIEGAGSDQDRIYLNKFESVAAEEKRFVIKNICKTETMFMINQLGGEKKVKDADLRVFEEGQAYIKDKKDIPPDILALIIKHLILKMKVEYLFINRQRLEVKDGMRIESTTMVNKEEVRGSVNTKTTIRQEPDLPLKGKGKQETIPDSPTEQIEGKKYNTVLRVRGEEWRDKVYVDDFPTDGPNLYVAITGFMDPYLPGALVKIGIPLVAVVQIRIDTSTHRVPSSLMRPSKRGTSKTDMTVEKSIQFWEDLQKLRIHKDSTDEFKNTAFVLFSPPYWDSETLSSKPDKIYNECCFLMFDIQDLTRQHAHYLENMKIINISEEVPQDQYMNYYNQQMQDWPLECVTIYSLLDSILHTVTEDLELEKKINITPYSSPLSQNQLRINSKENSKIEKAETLVKQLFGALCSTEDNKKSYRVTYGDEYENHKDPIVINHGDIAKYNTFHINNIHLENIVFTSLLGMPINKLWKNQKRPHGELEAKINFHVNVLLSSFDREDVETVEVKRLLHILACRKLFNNRSSLIKNHLPSSTISEFKKVYLKRSILAEPLSKCSSFLNSSSSPSFPSMSKSETHSSTIHSDDSKISHMKFLFDCPDISELVSSAEISNEKPIEHFIEDFEHFEDFSGDSAFQILREVFNKFNCVDYRYCEVTDCFILMFFNSHDKDGVAREEWRSHIPTPTCLQDFFDFVLEEHYDWIQNEEKIYDETLMLKSQSELKDVVDPFALSSCLKNTDIGMDLFIEGSLKFQELVLSKEASPELTETNTSLKTPILSPSSTGVSSKKSKKDKSLAESSPKKLRQSLMVPTESNDSLKKPTKPFSGYDISDRRVELFGQNSTFFSRDGTKILSKYTLTIPTNLEYIILNIVPGNDVNEFWLHKALGEDLTPDIVDICESFRIASKDQVMINIIKRGYQVPIALTINTTEDHPKPKDNAYKSMGEKYSIASPQLFEFKNFHTLFVTWPNGLITETVQLENSSAISHIKQYYVCDLSYLEEDMRCISLNGEVIVFKTSGIIEVLRPDSSYIKITKCEKRIVKNQDDDMHSETSSEKAKKGKSKPKSGRVGSKSSKNSLSDDKPTPKLPEYELAVEEFETIDTDGTRLKWINEISSPIEKILIRTATEFCLREVFSRRMDGTNILLNKDGVHIVTFPDDTKIITTFFVEDSEVYPEWTDEEKLYFDKLDSDTLKSNVSSSQKSSNLETYNNSIMASSLSRKMEEALIVGSEKERTDGYISVHITFTIEHKNFTTITINKADNNISVESPNNTKIVIDSGNNYDFYLDNATTAYFNGETLHVDYKAFSEYPSNTTASVKVKTDDNSSVSKIHQHWLTMKDSFGKKVVVNEEGHISIIEEPRLTESYSADTDNKEKVCNENVEEKSFIEESENSSPFHDKCREIYSATRNRFFVLERDLSCSELVHRVVLDKCKRACRDLPWCSITQHDTFGDHRSLLSILTPVYVTETEKWLMNSKFAVKPEYLAYKDLKKDPGKGFYHWMRPYKHFQTKPKSPATVLTHKLPRAFLLRTLEQQWKESERAELSGAKELIRAILRYRRAMESESDALLHVPIRDRRSEQETHSDDVLQALGHRIYEDLRLRLEEDVQTRAEASITTNPLPVSIDILEEEDREGMIAETPALEDNREVHLKEAEAVQDLSPNLKRYWRRRAEEYKEEQFHTYLLREGNVPPYFSNVLGGAFWWEINNTAGEAAFEAERKKNCLCAADEVKYHN